jgi:voltage-gated potassium channel
MKLLRMLRLVRIVKLWGLISSMPIIPRALKVFLVSTGSLILIHWFTSIWILIHPLEAGMDRVSYYIECFYWAVTTLTTVGYGDITPKTNAGRIYTMFVMFIGVGVYGFVIGNISRIFAESARYKEQTREKYAELNTFMKYYHIPNRLQGAVFNYYNHLFTKRLSDNDAKIISELPQALKAELQVYMNMKLIRNLPVFKYCSQACLKEVASALEQKFYSPSDTIIRIGELGDEMFVIGHGVVDVILEDGSVVAQLHEGQFFGEAALLKETTRNANVRAATYTDLYRLSKDNFLAIIENHPDLLENLQNVSTRRASDRNRATSANT